MYFVTQMKLHGISQLPKPYAMFIAFSSAACVSGFRFRMIMQCGTKWLSNVRRPSFKSRDVSVLQTFTLEHSGCHCVYDIVNCIILGFSLNTSLLKFAPSYPKYNDNFTANYT